MCKSKSIKLINYFSNILVVIGDYYSGQIEYFDNGTFTNISSKLHTNRIRHLIYLPYKNGYVASASADTTVNVWDTLTWASIQRYTMHTDVVFSVDQIDNDTIVSGSQDNTIRIWKISTSETLQTIRVTVQVYAVRVFSIESKQIVCGTGATSDNLRIYNYSSGDLIRILSGHSLSVLSIEILSEQMMASGGYDQRVIIWDLSSYSIKYTLMGGNPSITCVRRLSSNLIASGDLNGLIIIWNWLTGKQIFNLIGHTNAIYSYSLDLYDEQTLISGSLDETVKFWNITNGELIQSKDVDIGISALAMLKSSK